MTQFVTPDADTLGIRVTYYTPLAQIVGALRRLYPAAPYTDVRAMAEQIRAGAHVATPAPEPEPEPEPAKRPRKRQPKNEAEASLVPVTGGEPIPAEPPEKW